MFYGKLFQQSYILSVGKPTVSRPQFQKNCGTRNLEVRLIDENTMNSNGKFLFFAFLCSTGGARPTHTDNQIPSEDILCHNDLLATYLRNRCTCQRNNSSAQEDQRARRYEVRPAVYNIIQENINQNKSIRSPIVYDNVSDDNGNPKEGKVPEIHYSKFRRAARLPSPKKMQGGIVLNSNQNP